VTIDRSALERAWVHSHEEDTAGEQVFRPAEFAFPPSRGRRGFQLRADGTYVDTAPGPTDRPEEASGSWELDGDTLVLSRSDAPGPERLRVAAVDTERLVVARG
jgi:hypothetical protein